MLPAFKEGVEKSYSSNSFSYQQQQSNKEETAYDKSMPKKKNYETMTKAVFIPASYDEDKQKDLESISFCKGAMIKAFFEVDIHDPREIQEWAGSR